MIVAEQKPLSEIQRMLKGKKKVLAVGCGTCVSVCFAGGSKETGALAATLRTAAAIDGEELDVHETTVQRQCVQEFIQPLEENLEEYDAILSMACGVGVQTLAERYTGTRILPGLDTNFMGQPTESGVWEERCVGCGHCVLEYTGGLCPITRCPKQLMNGPCGGAENGMCEVDSSIPCVWNKIWEQADNLELMDMLMDVQPPKDWTKSRGGSMRRVEVREDLRQPFQVGVEPKRTSVSVQLEPPGAGAGSARFARSVEAAEAVNRSSSEQNWSRVCARDEVAPQSMKRFDVGGVALMVANLGDCLRAFPPLCPHMAEPLDESGRLETDKLTCTKHIWQWNLRTGELCGAAERPLHYYELIERDGVIFVCVDEAFEYEYEGEEELDDDDFFGS